MRKIHKLGSIYNKFPILGAASKGGALNSEHKKIKTWLVPSHIKDCKSVRKT